MRCDLCPLSDPEDTCPESEGKYGLEAERLCQKLGLDYYIKDSLRKEMEG